MAINFTDSPANGATQVVDGRTYTYNSTKNKWDTTATEVTGPTATVYATVDALPTSGNLTGAQAYVSGNNRLYIWNGTGWYNIALINTAPSISGVSSSYALATDGTVTTVTITASDPEGLPITYSIVSDTSGNIATVTQSSNVFTITPTTNTANAGTFSLTFRASDGVNLATAVAEFSLVFQITNSNYTTSLITTNGSTGQNTTFTDSSTSSHTLTASGNVHQTSFSPYRHGGYSAYFDGTDDFIEGPAVDLMGSGAFTVECWAYINSTVSTATDAFLAQYQSNQKFIFGVKSDVVRVWMAGSEVLVGTTNIIGEWHHFALVRDSNNSCQVYIDGVAEGSAFTNTTDFSTSLENFEIGSWDNGAGSDLDGYITDLRVVKGTAVYTAAFTPPTERLTAITNTSLLACHLPYFADGSTNGHTLTPNGNVSAQPFGPYDYQDEYAVGNHGGSAYFDSNSSYLSTPDSDDWYLNGDFTIEFWLYKENSGTFQIPFSQRQGSTAELRLVLDWSSGNVFTPGNIMLEWHAVQILVSGAGVRNETWNHLVIQRSGTSVYMYLNGYMVHGAQQPSALSNYAASLTIGSYGTNAYDIKGNLTDFRWVKGTALYSTSGTVGDKLFTPPTDPLTAITNTKLLLNMQGAVILDKSQSVNSLPLSGNTTASTAQYKYLPSSIYFDGSGDYIRCDDAFSRHTSVTQPYTIEMWSRVDSGAPNSTFECLLGINRLSDGNNQLLFHYTNSDYTYHYSGNAVADTGANLTVDSWEHIAIVGNDGTNGLAIYVNGVQAYTTSTLLDAPLSECSVIIGAEADAANGGSLGNYYQGYMSDIRFTTGLARYTANFTPPSAALDG